MNAMDIKFNHKTAAMLATIALGYGTALVMDSPDFHLMTGLLSTAQAQGHDSGSKGGGHDSGGESGGTEEKGHGTRGKHEGHSSGQHGSGSSHAGSERFGGGSGVRGNDQVPEGIGRNGDGAPTTDQGRLRYWGGWTLPENPETPTDTVVTISADVVPGSGGGPSISSRSVLDGAVRCEGVVSGMPPAQQFAGSNLLRLNAARGLVDHELAASGKIASPFLMGNLQDELTKAAPNTELAGTYLGLIAKNPVTADTVKKIGFQLCAGINDKQAKEIADVAEAQRNTLAAAAAATKANP